MQPAQQNSPKIKHEIDYRQFLKSFKTQYCSIYEEHQQEFCFYYHSFCEQLSLDDSLSYQKQENYPNFQYPDRRRDPYSKMNQIVYSGETCKFQNQECLRQNCKFSHNYWQLYYHPNNFKTIRCENFYDCQYQFCFKLHYYDYKLNSKNNTYVLNFSEFFRFDLNTFKTKKCTKEQKHDKSFCLFYHSFNDCRRPNFKDYGHILCKKSEQQRCQDLQCPYSHNKIQQLYHPSRYKSKFCENHYLSKKNANSEDHSFKSSCPFNQFCSFAHDDSEISVQLIHKLDRTLQFHLYVYKTVWCPITTDHNRSQCVYAHNIQDYRRNPNEYYYEAEECPDWKKNENIKGLEDAGCPKGMNCGKCHGWKQKQYHPIIFSKSKGSEQKNKQKSQTSSEGNKEKTDSSQARQYITGQDAVELKLGSIKKTGNKLQKIISSKLKGDSKPLYKPGTPFFKQNSKGMKPKSKSEKGQNVERVEKYSQPVESVDTAKSIYVNSGISKLNVGDNQDDFEKDLFKVFQTYNEKNDDKVVKNIVHWKGQDFESDNEKDEKQSKSQQRSKSVQNKKHSSSVYYSNEMTQVLNPKIIGVLQNKKINEIKLINMGDDEIRRIDGLTTSQKNLLIVKISKSRPNFEKTPTYTGNLKKFFTKYKQNSILSKMKTKKVKQTKLLLLDNEIPELSFLTESEKSLLPLILREYTNNQEFDSINEDISKQIGSENQ